MESQATVTGPTLLITIGLVGILLVLPRKYLLLPYVVGACFAPADQAVMVGVLHFQVLRILVVAGMLRLAMRSEIILIRWNRFDHLILAWAAMGAIVYVTQWRSLEALIFQCGRLFEALGLYWMFRQTIRSWRDLRFAYAVLAVCALVMTPFVAVEWATGKNPFTALGRVTTSWREGNFRCAATFPHAIIMGLFWATLVPLFVGFAKQKRSAWLFWGAVAASLFMIWGTASSTPVLTLVAVVALLLAFPWRRQTRTAAWGVVVILIALQLVMKAPVWHLLARVGVVSGSTGWHRYYLIDQAIRHFPQWMLLGTRNTGEWGLNLQDVTNQFILEGVQGGLITLVLFCAICFVLGRVFVRLSVRPTEKGESYLAWGVFVTLIGHMVSFFGVSYFGQITMLWWLLLASAGHFCGKVYETPAFVECALTKRGGLRANPTVCQSKINGRS
jgi:hypothetical protein